VKKGLEKISEREVCNLVYKQLLMWLIGFLAAAAFAVLFFMHLCAKLSMPRDALSYLPQESVAPSFASRFRQAFGLELTIEKANLPSGVGGVTPAEVLKHAAEMGLKLTPAQATESPLWRVVQAVGMRSPF
jgi:hypothetical protein